MYFIGLMSGTSMDAVDVALVTFEDKTTLVHYQEYPLTKELRRELRAINKNTSLADVAEMDHRLGQLYADSINRFLDEYHIHHSDVVAVGSHGQTVFHDPDCNSLQIGDPNIIATKTHIDTVADFRRIDMALNGQGAPLASAFHQYQFQQQDKSIVVLNIGGMANITYIPALSNQTSAIGFDTGPGNALLDDWIQQHQQKEFDEHSQWALTGNTNTKLLEQMLADHYFSDTPPKSTGRDYFNPTWIEKHLQQTDDTPRNEDVQSTLLALTINTITDAINKHTQDASEIVVCGGGAYNEVMLDRLSTEIKDKTVFTTDNFGLRADCIEAVCFAWLAKQRMEMKVGNLPSVTGSSDRAVLGALYLANN